MTRPLLMITWHDHYHFAPGTWVDLDGMEDLTPCDVETVGWLIDETPMIYALAQSITEAVDASGVFVIIKSCVTSVRELEPQEAQPKRRKRGKS